MKLFSKFLVILTTLVLLSCPLFSAFANSQLTPGGQVTQSQVGETWFYDAIGNRVEASTLGENNALVQVSKSVQSTGTENEFKVTLNVTTEEDLTTLSKSNHAAVLLVLDYSGSMEYAMGSSTRMVALKKAANAFLQTFALQTGAAGADKRLAAAVIFDQDAHLHMPWIDLRSTTVINDVETSNLNLAQSRIESITSHSGTNIEGGMHAAASYMNSSRQHGRELENVDYLYTILITDGQPGTGSPYDEDRRYLEILMDTNKAIIRGTAATSDMGGFDYVDTVGDAADVIKGLSKMSEVYGVCLDVSNSNLFASAPNAEQQKKLNPSFDKVITIGEWFQLFCDHFYPVSGDNAAGLNDAFSSIATKIQTGTSAFRLQDTMGTDVKYLGAADSVENVVEANGDSFVWDLRNSPRTKQTVSTDNVDTTVYSYTYKYKTRLDNLAAGFAANTPAAVNDNSKTELEYISTGTDGRWQTNTIYKVKLPVPKVQGYSCDLSFTKVKPDGVSPLAGAKFTLTHNKADCTCSLNTSWTQDFTSLADGKVSFSDIPSGHVYTLAEIPPTGYASPGTLRVSTVLGTATLSGTGVSGSAGSYVVKNDKDTGLTGNLKITKAFSGHSASEDVSFVVEKTSTDGIPYSTTVTLSAANNWTTQLYSIPSGTYVVKEVLSDVQFKDYDHTVSVKVDNVSAQVVEDSTHASVSLTVPTLGGTVAADFTNQYTAHTGKIVIRKSLTQTGEKNYMAANGASDLAEIKAGLSYVIGNAEGGTYQSLVYSDLKPVSGQDYVEYTVTLPVGKYTLQETGYKNSKYLDTIDNFTFTLTDGQTKYHLAQGDTINGFITETSESVYVDRDETVLIHYTNNYVLCSGELEIRKFFHGVPDELKAPTQAKNLAFTYQNNSYESVTGNIGYQNFTASSSYDETHGNNYRYYLKNAPVSTYTVTEKNVPDYSALGYRYVKTEWSNKPTEGFQAGSVGTSGVVGPGTRGSIYFVNIYVPQGKLTIRKQITGDLNDAEIAELLKSLTFAVEDSSGAVIGTYSAQNAVKESDGWYVIQTGIALDEGNYTVTETGDSVALFSHTSSVSVANATASNTTSTSVQVQINHDNWANPAVVSFTNNYVYQTTSAVLSGSKVLKNRDFLTTDSFTFTLAAETAGAPMPAQTRVTVSPAKNASFSFDSITYTKRHAGNSYTYLISETAGSIPGITYDTTKYRATVTVNEVNGALSTSTVLKKVDSTGAETAANAIVFTNVYTSKGSLTLSAVKNLTGRTLKEQQFSFELKSADGTVLQTVQNAADGSITFEQITYTQEDLAASPFTYTISEVNAGEKGYTYDDAVHTITVTLEDNGDGTLTATADKTGVNVPFTNIYEAEGSVTLSAHKTLNGRTLAADQFSFELKSADGTRLQTVKNAADGSITFGQITYTQEDLAASPFTYTISEVAGAANSGYTYDNTVHTITVTLEDNGDGTLTANADKTGKAVTFTNTYQAKGSMTLSAHKTLNGRTLAADQFSFELKSADGTRLQTVKNAADGSITFAPIDYTEADLKNSPFTYTISEIDAGADGYTYDAKTHTVKVSLADNSEGVIIAMPDQTGDAITFTNSYEASGSIHFTAHKTLTGRALETEQFTFELVDTKGNVLQTVKNDANGNVRFAALTYTQDDVAKSPFQYIIREKNDGTAGYSYDNTVYTLEVTVTDNGNGKLTAAATAKKGEQTVALENLLFHNSYEAVGSVTLEASKVLSGRTLEAGQFSFELKAGAQVLQTKTNNADGLITFDQLSYDQKDAGKTFDYTISEVKGSANGYTYDDTVYNIRVTVTDNGDATLSTKAVITGENGASTPANGESVRFANIYTVKPTSYAPRISKMLTGEEPTQTSSFTFTLTADEKNPQGGAQLSGTTVSVDGAGEASFGKITFLKAGTYRFTIAENDDGVKGYYYDKASWLLTVVVEDVDSLLTVRSHSYVQQMAEGLTSDEKATFTNVFSVTATTFTPAVTKAVTGVPLRDECHQFTIRQTSAHPDGSIVMPADKTASVTGAGQALFEEILFLRKGVYTFAITEMAGADPACTYDSSEWTLTVTVTETDSVLSASGAYSCNGQAGDPVFTNHYQPGGLLITKEVTGSQGDRLQPFTFVVNVMYNGEMHDSTYTWQIVSPSWPGPMSGTIANGGCVQLRHGQSVMLYGLPAGATYEVVELEADLGGYVTVAKNATGIIAADAAQTVRFFNHCMLPDPPTTGDPAQPMLYAVLSLLGLLGLCTLRRKRC